MLQGLMVLALGLLTLPQFSAPVIRAALDGEMVYISGVDATSSGKYLAYGSGALATLRQDLRQGENVAKLRHVENIFGNQSSLLRWQIIDKKHYCVLYRVGANERVSRSSAALGVVPLASIELVNEVFPVDEFQKRREQYRKSIDYWPFLGTMLSANDWEPDPIKRAIFFDIWATAGKRYEVYVTEPHKASRLTREDFHPERVHGDAEQQKSIWEKAGEWKFDWTGPFYVAANGNDRFFVTDTGRVFVAPRAAKPGMPLKEIWNGPRVDTLIHDSDAKKWYAFTKDQYFEVADPVKPRPHAISIKRAWTANDALETAAECGFVIRNPLPPPMNERVWDDLASPVRRVGHKAVWAMTHEPARAVALLKERLKQVQSPSAKELAGLIDDLGSESFAKREAAQKRLREFGATIEPNIREAANNAANPERKRRLNHLLTECQSTSSRTPDEIRAVRAVQVMERISTKEARDVLQELCKGAESAVLTREARKALKLLQDH